MLVFLLIVLFLVPTQFEKVKDYKKTYKNNQSVLGRIFLLVSPFVRKPTKLMGIQL